MGGLADATAGEPNGEREDARGRERNQTCPSATRVRGVRNVSDRQVFWLSARPDGCRLPALAVA